MNSHFRILKIYILLLTSILLFFAAHKVIVACAGGDEEDALNYSAFAPEIIEQPQYSPFFFTYDHLYQSPDSYLAKTSEDYNVSEWFTFFDEKISKEDVTWFIYNSTPQQLELIHQSLWEKAQLPDTLKQKTLIHLRLKDDMSAIINYLITVKNATAVFNPSYDDWYQPVVHDSAGARFFIKEFLKGFTKNRNLFLKHRFGFQLMRSFYYAHDYQKVIDFMNMMPGLKPETGSIFYRCLGYKAAALYKLKRYKESNVIYAQLFDEYEPQQISAYRSFHLLDDTSWTHTISMAHTMRQKEQLWQLYGIYANPLKAMYHIYQLNPASDLIPLLVVRNINMIETHDLHYRSNIYQGDDNWNYYSYQREPFIDSSLISSDWDFDFSNKQKVLHVLHQIIKDKKVPVITPYLISASYLHCLSKQYNEAITLADEALKLSSNALIKNQAEIIKSMVMVMQMEHITELQELQLAKQLALLLDKTPPASRAAKALNYVMYILGSKYEKQGDELKAELCYSSSLNYYASHQNTDKMLLFMEQEKHNDFENMLLMRYHLKIDAIHDIKGIRLLYDYHFAEAFTEFEKVHHEDTLLADPFTMRIVDCHDCDFSAPQKIRYTRKSFAKKMLQLQQSFTNSANKETIALQMIQYANALYNMTYFGNGRCIAITPISWMDWNYSSDFNYTKYKPDNYYNCTEALHYYLKAQALTNNKELSAQCTWGAAKCEHNLKLMNYLPWQTQRPVDFEAGTYFTEMKTNYSGTKYYNEVLQECGYFCSYITKDTTCIRDKEYWRER